FARAGEVLPAFESARVVHAHAVAVFRRLCHNSLRRFGFAEASHIRVAKASQKSETDARRCGRRKSSTSSKRNSGHEETPLADARPPARRGARAGTDAGATLPRWPARLHRPPARLRRGQAD